MIYIYKHRNNINGKIYIGQTNNIDLRWMPSRYKKSPVFYRAIQKYGWDNFTHEILSEIEDQNEADNQEIALIAYFDSTNPEKGYNISYGGNSPTRGRHHTEETREKISNALTGKKFTEEHKKKMTECQLGSKNHNYGKKFSIEHRQKMSENNKNKKAVYLIDTIDGWDEYYPSVKDLYNNYPEWNYDTLKRAALKGFLFKKRYKIEYAGEV